MASPVILGISEHLGVGLPLGVVGIGAESAPPGLLLLQVQTVSLGISDHLGVEIPMGVVGLGMEPAPKVCSLAIYSQYLGYGKSVNVFELMNRQNYETYILYKSIQL